MEEVDRRDNDAFTRKEWLENSLEVVLRGA